MPRFRRRFNKRPKRNFRRKRNVGFRRRFGKRRMTSMRSRNAIAPDTAFTKLRYTVTEFYSINLPSPSATLATNFSNGRLIRGNDVYDPQSTSGTVPATGFNQWCAQSGLYQEFIVHGSKIKAEIVNLDNGGAGALSVALYPIMESNATITNIDGNEQAYAKTAFIGMSTGSSKVVLKNFMKTKKMIGVHDLTDDEQNKGSYNASPGSLNIWDWALDMTSLGNNSVNGPAVGIKLDVTYYVQFLQRPVVSLSTQ